MPVPVSVEPDPEPDPIPDPDPDAIPLLPAPDPPDDIEPPELAFAPPGAPLLPSCDWVPGAPPLGFPVEPWLPHASTKNVAAKATEALVVFIGPLEAIDTRRTLVAAVLHYARVLRTR